MALRKKGKYRYGDSQRDIEAELERYSEANGYPAVRFADAICACGATVFTLLLDDEEGAAIRVCATCETEHPIGDSEPYLEEAALGECECPCGNTRFEITAGVALYQGSEAVRWFYLGCRCVQCGLTACYGDWKSEHERWDELLGMI